MKKPVIFSLTMTLLCLLAAYHTVRTQSPGAEAAQIIRHRINMALGFAPTPGSTGSVTPKIVYHNGPVIGTPVIYYIWYGNWNQTNGTDTASGQQILRDLANTIGGSPHFQINTTYSITGTSITGNVTFGGETTDSYSQGSTLSDAGVQTVVNNAINSGRLPYNTNGIYFVLSSSDVAESSGFCSQYCGWHTTGTLTRGKVRWSFVGNAARCINACAAQTVGPNGNAGVDGMASVLVHELEEATTDPDLNAWYDRRGSENADKCAWTFGQNMKTTSSGAYYNMTLGSRNFLIQRNLKHTSSSDTCNVNMTQQ